MGPRHRTNRSVVGALALLCLAGCTPAPRAQVSGAAAAPANPSGSAADADADADDDPSLAQAEQFGAAVHPVDLLAPPGGVCPGTDAVAAAVGGGVSTASADDPVAGCSYTLDRGRSATVTYLGRAVDEVRAEVPVPTGPGQLVTVDLDGSGAFATLSGAAAAEDADTLVLPVGDGTGCWRFASVGVGDDVATVLVALADATAAAS